MKAISLRCHLLRRAYCCPANNSAQEIVGIRYYFVQMPKSFVRSFSLQKRDGFAMCRKAAVVYALFWPDCSCAELPAQLTPSVYCQPGKQQPSLFPFVRSRLPILPIRAPRIGDARLAAFELCDLDRMWNVPGEVLRSTAKLARPESGAVRGDTRI